MLRDVMQSAGMALYAEIGLILIFSAFLLIVVRTFSRKATHYEHLARLPFDDDPSEGPLPRNANHARSPQRPSEV